MCRGQSTRIENSRAPLERPIEVWWSMRPARIRRGNPQKRRVGPPPEGVSLEDVVARVLYSGSSLHKDIPSFAGPVPDPRPDRSTCPRALAREQAMVNGWLRDAIQSGWHSGCWLGGFPAFVWIRQGSTVYEAVRGSIIAGIQHYHGYPLTSDQIVWGLP